MKKLPLIFLCFLIFILVVSAAFYLAFKQRDTVEKQTFLMDAPIRIKVTGPNPSQLVDQALSRLFHFSELFNKFDKNSELSKLNRQAGEKPVRLSPELLAIIVESKKMNRLTYGEFDVTLGYNADLRISPLKREVYLKRKGVEVDLGGIAKGFAAAVIRDELIKSGAEKGIIDMHSTIAVFGNKKWKIGIQHPREEKKLLGLIELSDGQSLATSGDYERGKHIINPIKKQPATACQSVTIIGNNATATDALSTAVFAMGPKRGLKLIESLGGIEGLIVDDKGALIKSSGFKFVE